MITLKTLPQATAQEIFDQVAKHLLTQNKVSRTVNGFCMYRGEDGLKCAAGCLIADDEYDIEMDSARKGGSWGTLVIHRFVPVEHADLIESIQRVHDSNGPAVWRERLTELARRYQLNTDVLQ